MRIAAYLHYIDKANRLTGVGRTMVNMLHGLAHAPGVDLRTITYNRLLVDGAYPAASHYAGLPATGLPLSPAVLHRLWVILGQPRIDRWCPDADWLYVPLEIYVPTRRARLAVTVHDLHAFETDLPWSQTPEHRRFRAQWQIKFRPLVRHVRLFAAVSEFTRERLIEFLGVPEEKIAVVGNGVEEGFFAVAGRPAESFARAEGPYALIIGGLTARKGGAHVLTMAKALQQRGSALRVLVAGSSEAEFKEQSRALANVTHLGFVADADMPALVRGAVAVLQLSRYEGFGITAAEAMAAGTPAIVSSYASLPSVVGEAGIVVDVNQPEAIAEVVANLARDGALRRRYEVAGRQRAEQFHWQTCVEKLVAAMKTRG